MVRQFHGGVTFREVLGSTHLLTLMDDVLREEQEQQAAQARRREEDEWFGGNGASVNV